jgi:Transcription factor WhiB
MSWTEDAECHNYPKRIFYPIIIDDGVEWIDDGTIWEAFGDTSSYYDEARQICSLCPVKTACLNYAMDNKERYGMWGGLTPIERRRIERTARRNRLKEKRVAAARSAAETPQ